ncbi:hypothetical protein V494_02800 [Pseudogymnoascus sp. VKM F-4513 (FW-928)]|nr:hypothetical protein V494_02800 [Pseudogymnoascus sp. VKM F-4513 (FW-928)]
MTEISEAERARAKMAVQSVFDRFRLISADAPEKFFDDQVMRDTKVIDGHPDGRASFEFPTTPYYGNINGVLHGGAIAVIFDMLSTPALAPLSRPDYWDFLGGVTRSLNISYLRGVPINSVVRVNSTVKQVGRTMALIQSEIVSLDGKTTYCTCEHHKVSVPTPKHHLSKKYEVEWDRVMMAEGKLPNGLWTPPKKVKAKL